MLGAIAQAAATVALLSDGRFTLGLGAGERLNEHVVGRPFPSVRQRHEVFLVALAIIKLLWQGGGLFATESKASIVDDYRAAGGDGPRYAEVPIAWAPDPPAGHSRAARS